MNAPAICVTPTSKNHFFGYYDRCPWDRTNRYLLTMETDFSERSFRADDIAGIGVVDSQENFAFRRIAETRAWNFAQGALLHWMDSEPEPTFIHNDRRDGRFVAVVRNVSGRELDVLPAPVCDVSDDGRKALSLNFSRLARTAPMYGYRGLADASIGSLCPADDGIHLVALDRRKPELVIPLAKIARIDPSPSMRNAEHYFNHLLFNPSGTRFAFVHRWGSPMRSAWAQYFGQLTRGQWVMRSVRRAILPAYRRVTRMEFGSYQSRLFTANADGGDVRCLADDSMVSHYSWRDDDHLLCWARRKQQGDRYWLFDDRTGNAEVVGREAFDRDGHCSYSPDRRWILTDTYPDRFSMQTLILYHVETGQRLNLGRFHSMPGIRFSVMGCDLHPRFDREGRRVCFDSTHDRTRQLYVVDCSEVMGQVGNERCAARGGGANE